MGSALAANEGASKKKIISWAMWDWGTQPFNTVITTFVFSVYITSASFGSENYTSQSLATSTTIAGLFIALLAPVLGQNSDRRGAKLKSLRYLTWALAAISASLYVVRPDPSYLWVGLILLGVGSVVGEIAGVNYNALLDDVATEKNVGRVSARTSPRPSVRAGPNSATAAPNAAEPRPHFPIRTACFIPVISIEERV